MWNKIIKAFSKTPKPEIKELEGEVVPTKESIQEERLAATIQEVGIEDFTYLDISGSLDVIIIHGNVLSLRIEADPHVDDKIGYIVQQSGTKLHLHTPNDQWNHLRVIISGPNIKLKHIVARGSTSIRIDNLSFDSVVIDTNGSSDVKITGDAKEANIYCSGSSEFDGKDFEVFKSTVVTKGSSSAIVNVTDSLIIFAEGSSSVEFKPTPRYVSQKSSITSSIDRL